MKSELFIILNFNIPLSVKFIFSLKFVYFQKELSHFAHKLFTLIIISGLINDTKHQPAQTKKKILIKYNSTKYFSELTTILKISGLPYSSRSLL